MSWFSQVLRAGLIAAPLGGPVVPGWAGDGGAVAQDPSGQAAEPGGEAPALHPIAEGEITARANLVSAALRRIEALLEPAPSVARIQAALDEREVAIERERAALGTLEEGNPGARRLENMRLPWLELAAELSSWKATVDARFAALQEERQYLRTAREQWELTVASLDARELAPDQLARAESTLARVVDLESRVRERRNEVGTVAERIVASQETVVDALDRLEAATLAFREQWSSRDAAPLWRSVGGGERRWGEDPLEAGRAWVDGVVGYVRLYSGRIVFLIVSFFVFLSATLRVRRDALASTAAEAEPVRGLLGRPVSLALAAGLIAGMLVLPYPTGSVTDLYLLTSLLAVLRLGSVVLEGHALGTLRRLVALTVLVRVAAIWPDGSTGSRLLLLAVNGVALVLAVFELRAIRRGALPFGWRRVAPALTLLAVAALFAGLVAGVLGWLHLSRVLTEGTLLSLCAALGWLVAVVSARALMPVLVGDLLGSRLSSLRSNVTAVSRFVGTAVSWIAVFLWIRGALVRFQLDESAQHWMRRAGEAELTVGGLTIALEGVIAAVVVLFAVWLVARVVGFFLREQILPNLQLRRGSRESLITVTNYAVWGIGLALAASSAGLSGTQLTVVIGTLGLGIGFGLQTIVNNFVSGLILIFERPIKVGDTLQMPGYWGRVVRIGIRASVIRSFDGAEITVPNGDLISKEVVNWTGTDEIRRIELFVGVAYGTDPERVLEVLRKVAAEHRRVLKTQDIKAQMIRFGESALEFRLRCWTTVEEWFDVASDLHVAIDRELKAAGITIPFPQRDVHIKTAPASAPPTALSGARARD